MQPHSRLIRQAIRAPDDQQPGGDVMRFIASTDHLDRYETIVQQDWLEAGRMEHFARNPVVQWAHDYSVPPIGRAVGWAVETLSDGHTALMLDVEFDMADEFAASIAGKYQRGMLSAVSVGWEPAAVTPLASLPGDDPRHADRGWLLTGNTLWELSAVPVPGNAHAVKRSAAELIAQATPEQLRDAVRTYLHTPDGERLLAEELGPQRGAFGFRSE